MKVDFSSNMNIYRKREQVAAEKNSDCARKSQTDVADFSRGQAAAFDKVLMGAKASIQSAAGAPADTARLEALKQSVREGSYHVDAADLVQSFLHLEV